MRVAAVRLRLCSQSHCMYYDGCEEGGSSYPTAPVPVVINSNLVSGSSWNCLTILLRSRVGVAPSMRT